MRNKTPAPGHLFAVRDDFNENVYFYRDRDEAIDRWTLTFCMPYDTYRDLGGQSLRKNRVTEVLAIFA